MADTDHQAEVATRQWSPRMQDILIVSSFGMWSLVLGLSPVLVYHALVWS
jgi:hypothetical protein